MEIPSQNTQAEICREKKERILIWLSTSESPDSPRFSVARLFEYGVLPQSICSFFLYHLRREFQKEASTHFIAEKALSEEAIARMILTPEHITSLLELTINDAFGYSATPQQFLTKYLSEDKEIVALGDSFLAKLDALHDHEYFPDILRSWAENTIAHNITTISRSELSSYISDIDTLILRYATISQIVDLLSPLYDFYNHRDAYPSVDTALLIGFFNDKKLFEVSECLERNKQTQYRMKELVDLLSGLIQPSVEVNDSADTDSMPTSTTVETPPVKYEEFLSDLRNAGVVYQQPAAPMPRRMIPFEVFIDGKLRKRCIKQIFHDNEEEYLRFIGTINRIGEYEKAKLNLETTLHMHSVEDTSKAGGRLFAALKMRYLEKEHETILTNAIR